MLFVVDGNVSNDWISMPFVLDGNVSSDWISMSGVCGFQCQQFVDFNVIRV
jgi:hypothetical protein